VAVTPLPPPAQRAPRRYRGHFDGAEVEITYLVRDGEWESEHAVVVPDVDRGRELRIPAGFRYDLASIPRWLWPIIAPHELSLIAPLAHDWLYRNHDARYTRPEADNLFRDLMRRERVPKWRRASAYAAVRAFGAQAWERGHS
jgi:hypothetical protein